MKSAFLRLSGALLTAVTLSACSSTPAPAPEITPNAEIQLTDDLYLEWKEIPVSAVLHGSTTVGDDLEFRLEEDRGKGEMWQVTAYDYKQCQITIDHDGEDIWPIRHDEAEIEIKPLVRGTITVEMKCGPKTATIKIDTL